MRRMLVVGGLSVFLTAFFTASVGAQAVRAPRFWLAEPAELIKLHKDKLPPLTRWAQLPLVRISPDGKRYIYIRMVRLGQAIPYMGEMVHVRTGGEPATWDNIGIDPAYCRMSMTGIVWRADSLRVLLLNPKTKEGGGWVDDWRNTMFAYAMCWDVKNPQFSRPRCYRLRDKGETGCTSVTYSPDGKLLWAAYSDPKDYKSCGVSEGPQGRGRRGRILYRRKGAVIYHLSPSLDGKHLAWVEFQPTKAKGHDGPQVVVLDLKTRKVVHRVVLSRDIRAPWDCQPPVWTADSRAICYGTVDVAEPDRVHRRAVYVLKLGEKTSKVLLRDAVAVGAVTGGIVLNRGPACVSFGQGLKVRRMPASVTDDVVLCSLYGSASPITLVQRAYAQQVTPKWILYAQANGDDVLIVRAAVRRGGEASPRAAWKAVLDAMAAEDIEALKSLTTDKGFTSLTRTARGKILTSKDLQSLARAWGRFEVRWKKPGSSSATALMGPEPKEHGLFFKRIGDGWKLDEWRPGR